MTAVVDDPLIRGDAPVYEIPVVADRGCSLDAPFGTTTTATRRTIPGRA